MSRNRIIPLLKFWPVIVLVGVSAALRYAVWLHLSDLHFVHDPTPSMGLYREALRNHFWEYLYYEHTEPVGLCIVEGVLVRLFGDAAFTNAPMLFLAMVSGIMNVLFVYSISRRLGASTSVVWPICFFYSMALIPFEVWQHGWLLDHYTMVLVAFFVWALVNRTLYSRRRYDLLAAAAGGLLILIQKVAFAVVPVMVVATAWLLRGSITSRVKRTAIALTGPLLVAAVLIGKNVSSSGIWAPSSLAGVNVAGFLYAAEGYNFDNLYKLAKESGAPDWYLWSFRQAEAVQPAWGPLYGVCYLSGEGGKTPFQFDPLYNYLIAHGQVRLAQIVDSDRHRFLERPYLLPMAYEVGPRIAVEYGKISQQIFWSLLWRKPWTFLRQVARTHSIYLMDGTRFLASLMKKGLGIPYEQFFLLMTGICFFLLIQAYLAVYLMTAALFLRRMRQDGQWNFGLMVLLLGTAVLSGVFSVVCCENGRWFLQATPYLMVILCCFLHRWLFSHPEKWR